MKRTVSLLLCILLLFAASGTAVNALATDIAASGNSEVYIDIYLDADSEYPTVSAQYQAGDIPVRPDDPAREGQTFIDWYTSPKFITRFNFSAPLHENTAMYARFVTAGQEVGVNVFDSPDADYPISGMMYAKGDYVEYPPEPEYDLYNQTFLGWYTDRGLKSAFDFSEPVQTYVNLFPKIVADEDICWVGLYLDADDEEPISYIPVVKGESCPVPAEPGRDGEDFVGWYYDRALTKPADFTKPVYEDFELFPKFIPVHIHKIIEVPIIRATATTDGLKAHFECEGCDKWFEPTHTALIEIEDHDSLIIPARGPYLIGDADGSGDVDINDATVVQRKLAEMEIGCGYCADAADADRDGELSVTDATAIQRFDADMTVPFPINTSFTPAII